MQLISKTLKQHLYRQAEFYPQVTFIFHQISQNPINTTFYRQNHMSHALENALVYIMEFHIRFQEKRGEVPLSSLNDGYRQ